MVGTLLPETASSQMTQFFVNNRDKLGGSVLVTGCQLVK
jgi:hypothetical protein